MVEKYCQRLEQTGLPFQPSEAGQRLACFNSQITCHWRDDYPECKDNYGAGTLGDRLSNWESVGRCSWPGFKSLWD